MKITGLPSARAAAISRPEPPAAVGRGRVSRVGPGRAGQHGRGLDEHQVGAGALQHHVRVVRQQRVHGRVRGERGAGPRGQHAGDDQARRASSRAPRRPARREPGAVSADRKRSPPPARSPSCADASASVAAPRPGQAAALPPQPDQVARAAGRRATRAAARPGPGSGRVPSSRTARARPAAPASWPAAAGSRAASGPAGPAPRPARGRRRPRPRPPRPPRRRNRAAR